MTDQDDDDKKRAVRESVRRYRLRMRDLGIVQVNVMVPEEYLPAIKAQAERYRDMVLKD